MLSEIAYVLLVGSAASVTADITWRPCTVMSYRSTQRPASRTSRTSRATTGRWRTWSGVWTTRGLWHVVWMERSMSGKCWPGVDWQRTYSNTAHTPESHFRPMPRPPLPSALITRSKKSPILRSVSCGLPVQYRTLQYTLCICGDATRFLCAESDWVVDYLLCGRLTL